MYKTISLRWLWFDPISKWRIFRPLKALLLTWTTKLIHPTQTRTYPFCPGTNTYSYFHLANLAHRTNVRWNIQEPHALVNKNRLPNPFGCPRTKTSWSSWNELRQGGLESGWIESNQREAVTAVHFSCTTHQMKRRAAMVELVMNPITVGTASNPLTLADDGEHDKRVAR